MAHIPQENKPKYNVTRGELRGVPMVVHKPYCGFDDWNCYKAHIAYEWYTREDGEICRVGTCFGLWDPQYEEAAGPCKNCKAHWQNFDSMQDIKDSAESILKNRKIKAV